MKRYFFLIGLLLITSLSAEARGQRCRDSKPATAPSSDFNDNGDGTVTHLKTGLVWKRCVEGQSGAGCSGEPTRLFWDDAMAKYKGTSANGWRMPSIDELKGIVEKRCKGPSFNLEIFPNAPTTMLWSASGVDGRPDKAWQMYSPTGVPIKANKGVGGRIRLVRTP